ncbi:PREDICTED: axoneme-associated protein mst101(2) isoform X1 [Papilio xuthus]|uniref:Axoneme-associated protein mst101(2) isoform X1 n=1 Tax=Papilio xuthus TaxID=66420 RepID=A0AAJ6Z530_PAPXU|nr:PREDICTED: axoneme-associated protein mst101(2) isoform X1 [Papilio xuthus]
MSIFTELIPKINQISQDFSRTFNESLKEALECFDKFEADFDNVKKQAREKIIKEKTVLTKLQSINEDDGEAKTPDEKVEQKVFAKPSESSEDTEKEDAPPKRGSKKRSKHEVDDMSSPEVDKRQKRNASVVAKNIISKQTNENMNVLKENTKTVEKLVNVNLTQKLRREDSDDKTQSKSRKNKDENKENTEPIPVVQIKQEKLSILPEPMEDAILPVDIVVKQEVNKDDIAMPPPAAPVPKARKAVLKEKEAVPQEEESGRRRTRTRKQTDTLPAPPVTSSRATRASSRNTQIAEPEDVPTTKDARPKRTRGRKKVSEVSSDTEKESHVTQDSGLGSPSDKPRPKRTRKGQKAAEKETKKEQEKVAKEDIKEQISPKEEPEILSPILESHIKTNINTKVIQSKLQEEIDTKKENIELNKEEIEAKIDGENKEIHTIMNSTVVLHNGVVQEQDTPKVVRVMDETVVIEKRKNDSTAPEHPPFTMDTTVVLDKPTLPMDTTVILDKTRNIAMDATVVLERLPIEPNITEDNSLLTDDSDTQEGVTTPTKPIPNNQPLSAVKEKVQKFEELAARTTRTKTRAMAKKDDVTENVTPPDKISKVILSAENLSKMNCIIFNGKTTQVTSSATKPKSNIPTYKSTSSSTSKLSGLTKAREAAEEFQRTEKEDARRKKEAILEAKREAQKKKREEKMAAAAAAREQAERERRAALEAAARGRQEKQAHADQGKIDKLKEVERKKQEQARKLAEAEERRKAEEQARALKLIEEQKRAEATRKKQREEAEAMKKEEAQMLKEVLQRQKEYNEKQKLKYNNRMTPIKSYPSPCAMEPVYMADGFQFLNSDEDDDDDDIDKKRPPPHWSTSMERRRQLGVQAQLEEEEMERLFSMRPQCPDLRQIFPNIDRARLKRTSSAVWRTPPSANRYQT